jgi:hypothetical protein
VRLRREARGGDQPSALLAPAVLARRNPLESRLDLSERLPFGHRLAR